MTTTASPPVVDSGLRLPMAARTAMALCAVAAPGLITAVVQLNLVDVGVDGRAALEQFAADVDAYPPVGVLHAIAAFLWLPALLTVARVARAGAARLGLIGLVLGAGIIVPPSIDPEALSYIALTNGHGIEATQALVTSAEQLPSGFLGWSWLLGLIGLVLLGVAVLRGRSAPTWAGVALVLAPLAIPASWFAGSALALTAAWVALTLGFAGCGIALVQRRDEGRA
jgi:hypothetical protein